MLIATIKQWLLRLCDLLHNVFVSIVIDTATQQNGCSALSCPVLLFHYPELERNYSYNHY